MYIIFYTNNIVYYETFKIWISKGNIEFDI